MRAIETCNDVRLFLNGICDLIYANVSTIEKKRYNIMLKDDNSLVTEADIYVEKLISDYVSARLSDVVFVGEESFDFQSPDTCGYFAILDPIDGTENFCSGLKEWGLSFGLWRDEKHLGSLILLPELRLKLMTGDNVDPIKSRITGVSSSMAESLIDVLRGPEEYRIMGCAVYNIYNVIQGSFSRFINPKGAYVWDILPGIMLALEQGCTVLIDNEVYNGQLIDPRRKYSVDIRR